MHIALVHRDLHQVTRGGICTVYRNLADHLADRGHTITLITQDSPTPLPTQPRPSISVLSLPRTENLDAHRAAVADAITAVDPDIVECSTWEAELLAYAEASPAAPVVVRAEFSALTLGATSLAAAERRLLDEADAAMAVSAFAASDIRDAYGHRLPVVPNGVDRTRFSPGLRNGLLTSGHLVRLGSDGRVRERARCVVYGDSGSDLPLFQALQHTITVNAVPKLARAEARHFNGADLAGAYIRTLAHFSTTGLARPICKALCPRKSLIAAQLASKMARAKPRGGRAAPLGRMR